ncbi:MAG: glycerol-3-phosphate 1-O-acyltransferase PlsY [Ignavibacteriae bacterium]|nr:glycerol-3-phosphate 1-O-acyltransferase PlsY [Ignavibacteriota bacterium]
MVRLLLIIILSYLAGSLPTAVIISKLFFGFDIRERGSGNMGSTNAFRVLGVKWGIVVQIVDILKGVLAVVVISHLFTGAMPFVNRTPFEDITVLRLIAGVSAVLGHIFSAFVQFRGGKGINTATGMLIAIAPVDVGIAFTLFLLVVFSSGYISLGSIVAAITIPTAMCIRYNILHVDIAGYHTMIFFCIGIALLVIYTHRANIGRLMSGNENRFAKLQIFVKQKPKI